LNFYWVVFSASGARRLEACKAAELFTAGCEREIVLHEYRDGFLPYVGLEVKKSFEELKSQVNPDVIFTHWRDDAHQDHRLLSELTWNTFRNHFILEYEIPKYDGDLGRPNLYVPLDVPLWATKVEYLFQAFESQQSKRWFDRETFLSLMRIRGMECNAASGYAEGFHCRKVVF
jgi:LmbE family N-acetylglucosaminyl deacetylase